MSRLEKPFLESLKANVLAKLDTVPCCPVHGNGFSVADIDMMQWLCGCYFEMDTLQFRTAEESDKEMGIIG